MEDYTISPVTSPDDVLPAATAFMRATRDSDTFWEMQARYGPEPPFDALLKVLKASVMDPNHHVFKAVYNPTGEIVGMAQWKAPCWIEVEKVDPFAQEKEQPSQSLDSGTSPLPPVAKEPEDPKKVAGVAMVEDSRRQIWNAYITHVRGKKHVCELRAKPRDFKGTDIRSSRSPGCSSRTSEERRCFTPHAMGHGFR
jgi:hypothetical protein